MKRHMAYFRYVARHKWFVFVACLKVGVPVWRAIIHDWHKFLPCEWFAYARTFYLKDGRTQYVESPEFAAAWNHHQKMGKHHWQYWMLTWDRGNTECLPMPETYAREMVADWYGAGRAINGTWDAMGWFHKKIGDGSLKLHADTSALVAKIISETLGRFDTPESIKQRKRILGY